MTNPNPFEDNETILEARDELMVPPQYKIFLHNDDYTPMDFVVYILKKFFGKNEVAATEIMLHVHEKGIGLCGVYPKEIAETKTHIVNQYARKNQYPLQCTFEKE